MAKRIIKYGIYNTAVCDECECEFAFDKVDIEADGTVICPQCGATATPKKQ